MYLDGVDQTALGTEGTFPSSADMDFDGLKTIIGAYVSSTYPFDGNIDEVAVFTSELSAAQVLAIYNGGLPFDISEFSPVGWWRMGEDDAEGTTITDLAFATGPDLVTNGNFATDSDWTKGTGWSISDGVATHTGGTPQYLQQDILTVGVTYEITVEVTVADGSNYVQPYLNDAPALGAFTTVGTHVIYGTAVAGALGFALRGVGETSVDNVVVKKISGNPATLVNTPTWSTDTP